MRFAAKRKCRVAATASRTGWKITSEFFLGLPHMLLIFTFLYNST